MIHDLTLYFNGLQENKKKLSVLSRETPYFKEKLDSRILFCIGEIGFEAIGHCMGLGKTAIGNGIWGT